MGDLLQASRGLLAYTMWADRQVLDSLAAVSAEDLTRETGTSFHSLLGTMAHVLGAEQLWLSRFLGVPMPKLPGIDDYADLAILRSSFEELWPQLEFFLAALADEQLARDFTWTNSKGETHTRPFRQALLHVVNHSTYHRGQVVSLMRQMGYAPPSTDLVYFRGRM
ncbi:MAG: DinB family protein [Thermoanaerobaculia bacterium]